MTWPTASAMSDTLLSLLCLRCVFSLWWYTVSCFGLLPNRTRSSTFATWYRKYNCRVLESSAIHTRKILLILHEFLFFILAQGPNHGICLRFKCSHHPHDFAMRAEHGSCSRSNCSIRRTARRDSQHGWGRHLFPVRLHLACDFEWH